MMRMGLYGCNMYRTRDLVEAARVAFPDRLHIVACLDIEPQRAREAARAFGGDPYDDVDRFLEHDMDVVLISLPPHLHPEAFARCAAAGRDVYLEKPVCVNAAGRQRLIDAARAHPVRCYVGLSYRYVAPFMKVAEIVRRPDAGRLVGVHAHWMNVGAKKTDDPAPNDWRRRIELGGGQLINHCCHLLDWYRWIGGEMCDVGAVSFTEGAPNGPHEEQALNACFRYRAGGIAVFNLSQHVHRRGLSGTVQTEHYTIEWVWGLPSVVKVYRRRPRAADDVFEWLGLDGRGDNTELDRNILQMREFMEAWETGSPMPITLRDGIAAYDLAQAIRAADASGQRVAIPPLVNLDESNGDRRSLTNA